MDNWMSYDICFCDNEKCKKRSTCLRNTERLKDWHYPVSMSHFAPDKRGKCSEYLSNKPVKKAIPKKEKLTKEEELVKLLVTYFNED
jgi:hypothetical protein